MSGELSEREEALLREKFESSTHARGFRLGRTNEGYAHEGLEPRWQAYRAGYLAGKQASKWIRADSGEFPDEGQAVWVYVHEETGSYFAHWEYTTGHPYWPRNPESYNYRKLQGKSLVTHWQPLPASPKEGE